VNVDSGGFHLFYPQINQGYPQITQITQILQTAGGLVEPSSG